MAGTKTLAAAGLGGTHWHEPSQRLPLVPPYNLQAPVLGCLRPNNQQGWNTAPPISRQAGKSLSEHSPAHQRDKTQLYPPVGRNQSLPSGNFHKPLRQPHAPEGRQQKQEELQSCSLQNGNHNHRKLDKMRQQRNMSQMKEQGKTPEEQLSEVEIGNLLEKEFRIMTVKMIPKISEKVQRQGLRRHKKCLTKTQKN